jgi:hypothetical protein
MNKHEHEHTPELWLAMAILSWLVGTGLGYMLFY